MRRIEVTNVAAAQPYDNSISGLEAETTQDAIDELQTKVSPLLVPLALLYNGTLSNNDWIGYLNTLPGDDTPIVAPISSPANFTGFTWSNRNSSATFALEFRKNSTTNPIFYTYTATNVLTDSIVLPTPEPFLPGDTIFIQYKDQGTNAADSVMVLKFKD